MESCRQPFGQGTNSVGQGVSSRIPGKTARAVRKSGIDQENGALKRASPWQREDFCRAESVGRMAHGVWQVIDKRGPFGMGQAANVNREICGQFFAKEG